MPSGGHKNPLDTRRSRTPTARQILRQIEGTKDSTAFPIRTGRRPGISSGSTQPYPPKPAEFTGTEPEWAIYWAHLELKRKPGEDFVYISHVAGIQVDFEEFDYNIVLNIQGLYWHYEFSGGKIQEDLQTRAFIEATGVTLVNIDEDMALADPVYYLREALNGIDHSLQARGVV